MALAIPDIDALLQSEMGPHLLNGLHAMIPMSRQPPTSADLTPRPGELPSIGAAQPESAIRASAGIPSIADMAAPSAPTSTGIPSPSPGGIPSLEKPQRGFWGKLGHGLEQAGEIAGNIVAPNEMALIPGTRLHNEFEEARQARLAASQAETGLRGAEAEEAKGRAWTAMHPGEAETAKEQAAIDFRKGAAPALGFKEGTPEYQRFTATGQVASERPGITPQEQAYTALMTGGENGAPKLNPATQKPYTEEEALAAVSKAPQQTSAADDDRYRKIIADQEQKKTVSADDTAWAKAYEKSKTLGQVASAGPEGGTLTPLINPNTGEMIGTFNTKTGAMNPITKPLAGATTTAGAGVRNKQTEDFAKDYVNPAEAIERSYNMFQEAYDAIKRGDAKTGAEDMLMLSQHLGTTFGQVKGSRMNRDLIQEHKDAIGMQDRITRYANNLASGQQLSPDQREEFGKMISNMRELTWQIAAKEALRRDQPVNFLPANVQIKMQDSKGTSRPVPGNRVQEYLDKGAKLTD
jgi:hypothetical protein